MKLELGKINIKSVKLGDKTEVSGGVLTVSEDSVKKLVLEDEQIKSVSVQIALPGEKTRITPVKDVVEPRVKVSGGGGGFPGMRSKVE
ncbi:MAG: glycine/sarcosine/betaine reductase component B subunit, partial [Spirochaetes bacterium]|nr:glycine/sarcosine/betaine reductase component B subunit [Spirochaetota bacterium]